MRKEVCGRNCVPLLINIKVISIRCLNRLDIRKVLYDKKGQK